MPYTNTEARQGLLDALADAADDLAAALASLSGAHEQLDERQAELVEDQLFRPVQRAYGRARRIHAEFARRSGLPSREFEMPVADVPSTGVRGFIERAVDAVVAADAELVALQDSLAPIEVGDTDLRAGLADVREMIGGVSQSARDFVRTLGR